VITNIQRRRFALPVPIWALLLAVTFGLAGTVNPLVLGGLGAVLVISALTCGLLGHRRALALCPAILLIGGTKFRTRDPLALLNGSIDSQVLFELFLYAVVGFVTLVSLISEERIDDPTMANFFYLRILSWLYPRWHGLIVPPSQRCAAFSSVLSSSRVLSQFADSVRDRRCECWARDCFFM
jgi:hypothetical protein